VPSLPVEMAEEARQETVKIIQSSSRPRDNITRSKREAPMDVGPCHHGMARPQVADGGTASYMEGSCE
jgi:hypothetical protein